MAMLSHVFQPPSTHWLRRCRGRCTGGRPSTLRPCSTLLAMCLQAWLAMPCSIALPYICALDQDWSGTGSGSLGDHEGFVAPPQPSLALTSVSDDNMDLDDNETLHVSGSVRHTMLHAVPEQAAGSGSGEDSGDDTYPPPSPPGHIMEARLQIIVHDNTTLCWKVRNIVCPHVTGCSFEGLMDEPCTQAHPCPSCMRTCTQCASAPWQASCLKWPQPGLTRSHSHHLHHHLLM